MKPVPPEEFTGDGYEAWTRRLEDWQALFANLDAAQKAPLLKRALKGDAAAIARAAVPNDQLHQQDAFDRIMRELDRHYGTRSQIRQFLAFLNLLRLENQADGNLEVYLRKWSVANATLAEEGLDLPDTIKAFLILANAHLREQQLTQVLTSVEQMGPGQPVSSVNVDTVLRGIAQARHVRSAGARRPRVGLTAVTDGADDSHDDEGSEGVAEENDDDGDGDELDAEIEESPDFLAAVAQLRKEFRKKGKGKKKGKGAGRGQKGKPKGPGGAASGDCQWPGLDSSGDPKCFKLKDNKKCPKKHTEEDLANARAALRKKGLVPCFNAFDASSGNGFEPITRALGSAGISDTGAKKAVAGDRMIGRHMKRLRRLGIHELVKELPRPSNQTFQFGGGTKTAIRRLKIPFCVRTQLEDASTRLRELRQAKAPPVAGQMSHSDMSRALAAGEDYTVRSECGKYEDRWSLLVVSVVPGWLPLLFGYDSMAHHRLAVMPELGGMYFRKHGMHFQRVENAYVCGKTGVIAFELLPGEEANRASATEVAEQHFELISQLKGDFQESKETTEQLARAEVAPTAELTRSDVLAEDPSPESSSVHWDAWIQSGTDALESKDTAGSAVVTPAMSEKQKVMHLELVPPAISAQQSAVAVDPVELAALPDHPVANNDVIPEAFKPPPKYIRFEDSSDLQQQLSEPPEGSAEKKRKPRRKRAKKSTTASEKADVSVDEASFADAQPELPQQPSSLPEAPKPTSARAQPGSAGSRYTTERASVRSYERHLQDAEESLSYLRKAKPPTQKPVTRERLQRLHTLTKCTLSPSALEKLMRRANVPNITEALSWYRDIIAECPNQCGLAEYAHRHRLPRLHLDDLPFNQEIEMDLFKLLGVWHLIIVDRGTRWVEVARLPNKESGTVRDAVQRIWIYRHGAPARSVSDCGGEFMSAEFIKEMDTHGIFKEVTPAYASDRHALVERFVRTFREAVERATRKRRRLTHSELDLLLAIITCEANNDLQACGTSASMRAHGRNTSPFTSLLSGDRPPAEVTHNQQLATDAREAWRSATNDRAFQALLRKQLGPQANQQQPVPGSLVYYRRPPDPKDGKDGVVYRGPAEVLATSLRMEGAFLNHGGLLVRAAWEDCIPCRASTTTATNRATHASTARPESSDSPPLARVPEEELDQRDDADDPPPVVVQPLLPLGPGSSGGYGTGAPLPAHNELVPQHDAAAVEQDVPALQEPAPPEIVPDPDPLMTDLFGDDIDPGTPAAAFPLDVADWYADTAPALGSPGVASPSPDVPSPVEHHALDADDDEPVLVDTDPSVDAIDPIPPQPPLGLSPDDSVQLRPGDRVHIESTTSYTTSGKPRWYIAEVFEQQPDGRTSVRWETKPTVSQAGGVSTPDFETMDLRTRPWRLLRTLSTRGRTAPATFQVNPTGKTHTTLVADACGGSDSCGGQAAPSGALAQVLAAIAAVDAHLERVTAVGGGVEPSQNQTNDKTVASRNDTPARSVLTTLVAHAPQRVNAAPPAENPPVPTSLTVCAQKALAQLEHAISDGGTPTLGLLEETGAAVADSLHGHLDAVMYAYFDKEYVNSTSDAIALATIRELGLLWAPPSESSWQEELSSRIHQLQLQSDNDELSLKLASEVLVVIEHGMARRQGLKTATIAAVAATTKDAAPSRDAILETAVYQYEQSDLTDDMKLEAAREELAQWDKYEVWGSLPCAKEAIPEHATLIDSKYFEKPKIKGGKLIAKGRLTPRGCYDPERFEYRNDSPAVSKQALLIFLTMALCHGWEIGKVDISGAFLQGDPLDREIWVELPKVLIAMGLVDSKLRFRRLAKGAYGLNQAPRLWFLRLTKWLCSQGFRQSLIDPCLFTLMRDGIVVASVAIYVDDLLVAGKIGIVDEIIAALGEQFATGSPELSTEVSKMSYTGKDISFVRDPKTGLLSEVRVDQQAYIDAKIAPSIPELDAAKRTAQEPLKPEECDAYRELQGKLAWVGNTRIDVAVDVSEGASAVQAPTVADMKRNIKLARHVVATSDRAIVLKPIPLDELSVALFADGSWANEGDSTRGGHLVAFVSKKDIGRGVPSTASLVGWQSSKLSRVCTSTFDSETLSTVRGLDDAVSTAYIATEMRFGRMPNILERSLMRGFGDREVPRPKVPVHAYNDGKGLVDAVHGSKHTVRSKRRRVDIASLREAVESEAVSLAHCDTHAMTADGLTKRSETLRPPLVRAMQGELILP